MNATWYQWLKNLDHSVQGRIARKIDRARNGNLGDYESVGDGISEMRLHFGPGYRLYYYQQGEDIYRFLCGGNKDT
ncbi:MAG: type II toxin-antitoxin system RelE/ParE family toxin [Holophagales bacterium]|nr:type II toxin-antitoxin system RelE/ParE family toxin [Holophagales bacterium]